MTTSRAPRPGTTGTLNPTGLFDLADARVTDHTGHQVQVTQPYGCPKNGTLGHMYVNCLTCSDTDDQGRGKVFFVGLVLISSFAR